MSWRIKTNLIHITSFFESLGMPSEMNIVFPERPQKRQKIPVLYLLHGMGQDYTQWLRHTSIERYAERYSIAVVMPNAHRSWYTDTPNGERFFTYITEELPHLIGSTFPVSDERKDTFIVGLSMGGYGAFKAAMNKPERYAAAASLSGALDVVDFYTLWGSFKPLLNSIFVDDATIQKSPHNLLEVATELGKNPGQCPRLFQACGTEDGLYKENLCFRDVALKNKLPLTYVEDSGAHDWTYWDMRIRDVLAWIFKYDCQDLYSRTTPWRIKEEP